MDLKKLVEHSERAKTSFSAIVKIIVIISVIYAIYFNLWRILFIDVLLLILIFMPSFLKKEFQVVLPSQFEIVLLVFAIISFFLGSARGFVVQLFFGLAVGFIGFAVMLILYRNSRVKVNYFLIILFSISFSLALGTLSELGKYYLKDFLDLPVNTYDYMVAIQSLSLVLIGAIIACVFGFIYMKGAKIKMMQGFVESFKKKNPNLFVERTDSPDEVLELIRKGESEKLEFKGSLRMNLHTGEHDKRVELASMKTLVAFLNSEGGNLLIGVSDAGTILGIEKDHFQNLDSFNLHFTNLIKEHIGNEFKPYIKSELVQIEERSVLKVECMKSPKPVFLKMGKEEEFYIRIGPASVCISGSKLVDFIKHNF